MPTLPSHHDTPPAESQAPIAGMSRRRKVLIATIVIALVVLAGVLHLTGVLGGEGGH